MGRLTSKYVCDGHVSRNFWLYMYILTLAQYIAIIIAGESLVADIVSTGLFFLSPPYGSHCQLNTTDPITYMLFSEDSLIPVYNFPSAQWYNI